MPKVFKDINDPELAKQIKDGAIGVLPTDTIYGLVASAKSAKASEKVLAVKGRKNKPGTLLACNIEQLEELGIKKRYLTAVSQFWPGPVSVILPVPDNLDYLHVGRNTLPVRITDDKKLVKLLNKTGPLITTSANLTDKKPAENLMQAQKYFGETIDFYVDGGQVSCGPPSTIIRVIDDAIEVVREGAVKINEDGSIR